MIAEKFQPLIAVGAVARSLQRRNMREGRGEQRRIVERITDTLLDRRHGSLRGRLPARLLDARNGRFSRGRWICLIGQQDDLGIRGFVGHRTKENRRFHRTAVGQRQICQACSPSAMEKKIICARPMTFSSGT